MPAQIADVLVMGGLLVSGDNVTRADVLISDGGVREVGPDLSGRDARRVIPSGNYGEWNSGARGAQMERNIVPFQSSPNTQSPGRKLKAWEWL